MKRAMCSLLIATSVSIACMFATAPAQAYAYTGGPRLFAARSPIVDPIHTPPIVQKVGITFFMKLVCGGDHTVCGPLLKSVAALPGGFALLRVVQRLAK